MIDGVFNIDKSAGMTSHDVVGKVRRIVGQKRVGHAGTLDPDATGVLLVCVGHATRLADLLAEQGKRYRATLSLGTTTSTEDASGLVLSEADASHVTHDQLAAIIPSFVGNILQTPPMVSALHHHGQRLYDLARQGIEVEREARTIHIDSIDLLNFIPGTRAQALLDVVCGKGTYIRTLCADLGARLGVGGHMASLRRTAVGSFLTDTPSSVTLEQLAENGIDNYLVSPSNAVAFLPQRQVTGDELSDLDNGKQLVAPPKSSPGALMRLVGAEGTLLGLGRVTQNGTMIQPEKVFKDV